jgi:uncharacterized protein (TIGR03083 family)
MHLSSGLPIIRRRACGPTLNGRTGPAQVRAGGSHPIGSQQRTDARHDRCVAGTGTGEMGAVDGIAEWTRAQRRVIELVEGLSAEQAEVRVPACPDWRVRDLFAHMVGLGVDVVDGDEPDDHNAAWTERQVRQRRDHDLAALIAEWESVAEPLREWMRANGIRPLGDVIIHEQDLRGALGRAGGQDTAGLDAIRDRFAARFRDRAAALPPIALLGDRWQWASRGAPDDAPVALRAGDFDLARALVSRRSAAQLRAWTVRGDVTEHLPAFATLGSLPDVDLSESEQDASPGRRDGVGE